MTATATSYEDLIALRGSDNRILSLRELWEKNCQEANQAGN